MPIAALPQTTVRAIGSASVIADPCSVVKELLDNALDASASSIIIEISQNTVDLIQVKDNGHGIPSPDHGLVCKRAFTSKIQTVEDLRKVGGSSLGFRGEALASVAEISGSLTINTRVEAEVVGFSVKYGRNGELISSQRASHPVGTSIRLTDVFKRIPVRRQTAVKNSAKELLKIKKLVQAYAISRPTTRLAFKVLKARSENSNWVYAPSPGATLMDAALKIAGTEIATNCILKEWPCSPESSFETSPGESNFGFKLVTLLPAPGSDLTKCNNSGQYISIDDRPVSTARGIAQEIAKVYRSYLRSVNSVNGAVRPAINDPFLCMHIQCPEGSYDVNIEPAKDDVLFEDSQALLSLVEGLLRDVYGDKGPGTVQQTSNGDQEDTSTGLESGHLPLRDVQLASTWRNINITSRPTQERVRPSPPHNSFKLQHPVPSIQDSRLQERSNNIVPPQAIRSELTDRPSLRSIDTLPRGHDNPRVERRTSPRKVQANFTSTCLPSPTSSSATSSTPNSNSSPPSLTRPSPPIHLAPRASPLQNALQRSSRERDRERYGNGSLDTWFLKSTLAQGTAENPADEDATVQPLGELTQQRFGPDHGPSAAPSIPVSPETPTRAASAGSESPQIPLSPTAPNTGARNKRRELPVLDRWSATLHNLSKSSYSSELETALEFETRKRAAIQERRNQLKSQGTTNSPHLSRYLAARSALAPTPDNPAEPNGPSPAQTTKPVLTPLDPRAYLIRQVVTQTSTNAQGGTKLKRTITNKLPFEKIPDGYDIHDLSLDQPADISLLSASFQETRKSDLYTQCGNHIEAFTKPNPSAIIELWSHHLSGLINTHYKKTDDGAPDIRFDFSNLSQISDESRAI